MGAEIRFARLTLLLTAATIIGIGLFGTVHLEKEPGTAFLLGSLTLGGGLLICALFSLKMPWHGIVGGGTLAFLGFCRGVLNAPDFSEFVMGSDKRGVAPPLELTVAILCFIVLLHTYRAWSRERIRRIHGNS